MQGWRLVGLLGLLPLRLCPALHAPCTILSSNAYIVPGSKHALNPLQRAGALQAAVPVPEAARRNRAHGQLRQLQGALIGK